MRLEFSDRAVRSYEQAPDFVCKAFDKQVLFLFADLRHPSLHAKKYDEIRHVWQGRVNSDWRFYFAIERGVYYILDIMKHPK